MMSCLKWQMLKSKKTTLMSYSSFVSVFSLNTRCKTSKRVALGLFESFELYASKLQMIIIIEYKMVIIKLLMHINKNM